MVALLWALLAPASARAQTLEIPGAGPPERLVRALANAFNERYTPLRVDVTPSIGQSGALDAVRNGRAPLARFSRRLTLEEERGTLQQTVIAREPIVFATGADVTISNVSRAQLAGIFSGDLTNWRELGGKPGPIRVLYREEGAEMMRIIRRRLPEFTSLKFSPNARLPNRQHEVIEALERFGWAVGFGPLGNVRAGRGLRVLALDGVVPSAETVRSGQYPLYYEATLIYKPEELKGLAKRFLDFVASPEGRKAIEAFGAVPLEAK